MSWLKTVTYADLLNDPRLFNFQKEPYKGLMGTFEKKKKRLS